MRPVGTWGEEEAEIEPRPEMVMGANHPKIRGVRTQAKSAWVRSDPDVTVAGYVAG